MKSEVAVSPRQIYRMKKLCIYKRTQRYTPIEKIKSKRRIFIMKEFVTVFTAMKARELLKSGYTIADIKPDKNDPDNKRSIFIFRNEEGLFEKLKNEL